MGVSVGKDMTEGDRRLQPAGVGGGRSLPLLGRRGLRPMTAGREE